MSKDNIAYMTPKQVASMMMVSVAAVRNWADKGELKARVTPGGHRRYLRKDVMRFAKLKHLELGDDFTDPLRVLIVDEDKKFVGRLRRVLAGFSGQLDVEDAENGFDAGLKIGGFHPDVILLGLAEGADGVYVSHEARPAKKGDRARIIAIMDSVPEELKDAPEGLGIEVCGRNPLDRGKLLSLIEEMKSERGTGEV